MNEEYSVAKGPTKEQLAAHQKREAIENIRFTIQEAAGDTNSLLGTTTDTSHFLMHSFASLIVKLHTANSLAEVRAAAEPYAELSTNFLAKVESGDVKLPFMAKGVNAVITDIEQRATAVSTALNTVTKGE